MPPPTYTEHSFNVALMDKFAPSQHEPFLQIKQGSQLVAFDIHPIQPWFVGLYSDGSFVLLDYKTQAVIRCMHFMGHDLSSSADSLYQYDPLVNRTKPNHTMYKIEEKKMGKLLNVYFYDGAVLSTLHNMEVRIPLGIVQFSQQQRMSTTYTNKRKPYYRAGPCITNDRYLIFHTENFVFFWGIT